MIVPALADCAGLWRRTLLIDADGSRDDSPGVRWLQGITAYVDSRGFAGRLRQRDNVFEWHRDVDLDEPGPFPDAGEMAWEGQVLVETGLHEDYVEHWVRDTIEADAGWGLFLSSAEHGHGLLMRVGDVFAFAGGAHVVMAPIGGPQWDELAIEMFPDRIQANGVSWTIDDSEGNLTS